MLGEGILTFSVTAIGSNISFFLHWKCHSSALGKHILSHTMQGYDYVNMAIQPAVIDEIKMLATALLLFKS